MRQIFLDTETTGLDHKLGHKVIEIGGVEMSNRHLTHRHFHYYLNPDRDIDEGAFNVHGISRDFLQDKPRFKDIAAEFLDFIKGAELIIHNAPFDVGFLNMELALLALPSIDHTCDKVTDTLKMAKELHPGKRNRLDALCERYDIDNSRRTLHGALLDAELLAEVYLAMTRGQESLSMDLNNGMVMESGETKVTSGKKNLIVVRADESELSAHEKQLALIEKASKGKCLWLANEQDHLPTENL